MSDGAMERRFQRSESIAALAAALAKAQAEMGAVIKDRTADAGKYKYSYADLASCLEVIRKPLTQNGLALLQFPRSSAHGVEVETVLAHASGEWVAETLELPVPRADAQGVGSAISYARRYALMAITGLAADDDDGTAAVKSQENLRQKALAILRPAAKQGLKALEQIWNTMPPEMKRSVQGDMPGLKEEACQPTKAENGKAVTA